MTQTAARIVAEIAQSVALPAALDALGDSLALRSNRRLITWAIAQLLTLSVAVTLIDTDDDSIAVTTTEARA